MTAQEIYPMVADLPIPAAWPTIDATADKSTQAAAAGGRQLKLTAASDIEMRPVKWVWEDRVPRGCLTLLAGREGIGKSTLAYQLAADLTRGTLPGAFLRRPRAVMVAATEDSWSHTIVPRLTAAGADLGLVVKVEVTTSTGGEAELILPVDLGAVEDAVRELDAGLILLDPIMSRLSASLDTHKDSEVRLALEPLVKLADRTQASVLGLIHVNKSTSTDPLTMIMGSRAFAAVSRAVLFAVLDPDDSNIRLLGQPKNNLGRTDLPTLCFTIEGVQVAETDEGAVRTGRLAWMGESSRSISDALERTAEGFDRRSNVDEAGDWLVDYLGINEGSAPSADIKRVGGAAGHREDALKKAARRLGVQVKNEGFPRTTIWSLSGSSPGESALTALTAPTEANPDQSEQSEQ